MPCHLVANYAITRLHCHRKSTLKCSQEYRHNGTRASPAVVQAHHGQCVFHLVKNCTYGIHSRYNAGLIRVTKTDVSWLIAIYAALNKTVFYSLSLSLSLSRGLVNTVSSKQRGFEIDRVLYRQNSTGQSSIEVVFYIGRILYRQSSIQEKLYIGRVLYRQSSIQVEFYVG